MLGLCVIFLLINIIYSDMLGPCNLIFQRLENCENFNNVIKVLVAESKYNRTTDVMDIALETEFTLGKGTEIELKGSMYKDGGWKPGAFYMKKKDACESLKVLMGDAFVGILKKGGVQDCPLPPGEYEIKNYIFDNDKFNVPQVYGEYKMEAVIFVDGKPQTCFIGYYELVPKKKLF